MEKSLTKAVSAVNQKLHKGPVVDTWQVVKPGTGAIVEELSTSQEWELLGVMSDISTMDPMELLIAIEDGTTGLE